MNRLRELRQSKNLTTIELGKILELDPSMITHLERDKKKFSTDSLKRACDFFGVSADYLLGISPEKMYSGFVTAIDRDWTEVSIDSSDDPVQVYKNAVSPLLQKKFDIIKVMYNLQSLERLNRVYNFMKNEDAVLDFSNTENLSENYLSDPRDKLIAEINEKLHKLPLDKVEMILQTAKLAMES